MGLDTVDAEALTIKIYDTLAYLLSQQEGVDIEYRIVDRKDSKDKTA